MPQFSALHNYPLRRRLEWAVLLLRSKQRVVFTNPPLLGPRGSSGTSTAQPSAWSPCEFRPTLDSSRATERDESLCVRT